MISYQPLLYNTTVLYDIQHAVLYQFVLSLNDGDVMSREAFPSVLTGNSDLIFICDQMCKNKVILTCKDGIKFSLLGFW